MGFIDDFKQKIQQIRDNRTSALAEINTQIQDELAKRDEYSSKADELLLSDDSTDDAIMREKLGLERAEKRIDMLQQKMRDTESAPLIAPGEYGVLVREMMAEYAERANEKFQALKSAYDDVTAIVNEVNQIADEAHACYDDLQTLRPQKTADMDVYDYAVPGVREVFYVGRFHIFKDLVDHRNVVNQINYKIAEMGKWIVG